MKHSLILFLIFIVLHAQQHLLTFPDISPDGKHIVFSSNTDLWRVPVEGGEAIRLTDLKGYESHGRFSPDGEKIVFSSTVAAANQLWLLDLTTKSQSALTYGGAYYRYPDAWSADSKYVYFSSGNEFGTNGFRVPATGGTPERLFPPNLRKIHNVQPYLNGTLLYTEFNSALDYYIFNDLRTGYRGANNADIHLFDPQNKEVDVLTTYNGNDLSHRSDHKGNIYFISDRAHGTFNVYKRDVNGNVTALTDYKQLNIKYMNVTPDASKLIFERDYSIYLLDLKTKSQPKKIDIEFFDYNHLATNIHDGNFKIDVFDIYKNKFLFLSHGRLFLNDRNTLSTREIPFTKPFKVESALFINEKSLLVGLRFKGILHLARVNINTNVTVQLTKREKGYRHPIVNQAGTKAYAVYGDSEIIELDLNTGKETTLVTDTFSWHSLTLLSISPDDQQLAYQAKVNYEDDIKVYHLKTKTITNRTETFVSEADPCFISNTELYFLSDQTHRRNFDDVERKLYKITETIKVPEQLHSKRTYTSISYLNGKLFGKTGSGFLAVDGNVAENISIDQLVVKSDGEDFYILDQGKIAKLVVDEKNGFKTSPIEIPFELVYNLKEELTSNYYEVLENVRQYTPFKETYTEEFLALYKHNEQKLPFIKSRRDFMDLVKDVYAQTNMSHYMVNTFGEEEFGSFQFPFGLPFFIDNDNKITFIVNDSYNVKHGDEIIAVNGAVVDKSESIFKRLQWYTRPKEAEFTFKRGNETFTQNITSENLWKFKDKLKMKLMGRKPVVPDDIAYHPVYEMKEQDVESFQAFVYSEYYRKNKIILDLRYNRGGNRHDKMIQLLTETKNPYVYFKTKTSGYLTDPPQQEKKRIVVLINEETLSDGEVFVQAFKELGLGVVIGQSTYGYTTFKSSVQTLANTEYIIPYWSVLDLNKQNLEMRGVEPDILVPQELSLDGSDKQLEAAIRYLNETDTSVVLEKH